VWFANYVLLENGITLAALGGKTGAELMSATVSEAAEKAKRYGPTQTGALGELNHVGLRPWHKNLLVAELLATTVVLWGYRLLSSL